MKIAIVHDWFNILGGAEKVVKQILNCYPEVEIFSLIDFLSENDKIDIVKNKKITTSFIQNLPFAKDHYQKYLQFFPSAIESFNVSQFDVVLSSSHAVAKGVLSNSEQLHICYCHTPMRYAWDLYFDYLNSNNLKSGLKSIYAKWVLKNIRQWDYISSNRVDYFIANSNYVAQRIKKIYDRESVVIYPPVDTSLFNIKNDKEDFYITASRLIPYKKIDLIIQTFNELPNEKLIIIGEGNEKIKLQKMANKNIEFLGRVNDKIMIDYLQRAQAFIFASKEDFGILPIEAQACGTPVIAYGKGGSLETIINERTGIFFYEQNSRSLKNAILKFKSINYFNPLLIRKHSEKFNIVSFQQNYSKFVEEKIKDFYG